MLALTVIFWPIKAILRWRYGAPFAALGPRSDALSPDALWRFAIWSCSSACSDSSTYAGNNHLELFSTSYDWILRIIQLFGLVGMIGVIVAVMNVAVSFGNSSATLVDEIHRRADRARVRAERLVRHSASICCRGV